MAHEWNVTNERMEEALVDIGEDIWTGYMDSKKCIGYIITDEGDLAQVHIIATTDKDAWMDTEIEIPEYDG